MKKKSIYVISAIGIIMIGIVCFQAVNNGNLKTKEKQLVQNNKELENKVEYLENQVETLIQQNEQLNNGINHQPETPEDKRTCTFTRTFHYTSTLDYQQIPEEKWIVFQAYQDHPFILRLENDFGVKFEKGAAYEITFTGLASNGGEDLNQYKVISIKKTNKVGMGQLQEPCRVEESYE